MINKGNLLPYLQELRNIEVEESPRRFRERLSNWFELKPRQWYIVDKTIIDDAEFLVKWYWERETYLDRLIKQHETFENRYKLLRNHKKKTLTYDL